MNITPVFLEKYNRQGPRYTSYPPATAFHTNFGPHQFIHCVKQSNLQKPANISIYIHVPFCIQRCHFCGCNTTLYENDEKVSKYIVALKKEISNTAAHIDKNRVVTQIHWGGGTPNAINLKYIALVMEQLRAGFQFADNCEIAMECSPAYLDFNDIDVLASLGFNRMSLGVQDFHENVLEAINRKGPKNNIAETLQYLKLKGFSGINIDLVYGLPLQTFDSFKENIDLAIQLSPDRLVTFSYAHVPWFNENQKKIERYGFPTPNEKLAMLVHAINTLTKNGYEAIGMDHFAKPTDQLAVAKLNKTLHRNFQGYCTKSNTGQVYAFGASSISQLANSYAQNFKSIPKYIEAVEKFGVATERGYMLSGNELLIRDIINEIMCNGFINFDNVAQMHKCKTNDVYNITKFNVLKIEGFINDGLAVFTNNTLQVSETGMLVVRNIAMAFDPALESAANKHSQTI